MPSSLLVANPPKETPFFTASGRISDVWLAWLNSLAAAGLIVQNLQALQAVAEDANASNPGALEQLLDALALAAEPGRLVEAADQEQADPDAQGWVAECAELRALVAAGDPIPFNVLLGGVNAWTGANTFSGNVAVAGTTARQNLSVGANLDLYSSGTTNSPTVPNLRGVPNGILTVNASGSLPLCLQWDSGSGGVNFGGGAMSAVASVSNVGTLTLNGGLNTHVRAVTAATDTATVNDHTLTLNGVTTETLPASPGSGQELYLVNLSATTAVSIAANGHNIWTAGTSAASISLAANATAILQYDQAGALWRQIK